MESILGGSLGLQLIFNMICCDDCGIPFELMPLPPEPFDKRYHRVHFFHGAEFMFKQEDNRPMAPGNMLSYFGFPHIEDHTFANDSFEKLVAHVLDFVIMTPTN